MTTTLNVTVLDGVTPVANARVEILYRTTDQLVSSKITPANGVVSWSLADDTYRIRTKIPGYTATEPTVVLAGGVTAQSVALTSLAITTPAAPAVCRLYGFVAQPTGGVPIEVFVSTLPGQYNALLSSGTGIDPRNQANQVTTQLARVRSGRWEVDVIRGAAARVVIRSLGFDKAFLVPTDATILNVTDAVALTGPTPAGLTGDSPVSAGVGGDVAR